MNAVGSSTRSPLPQRPKLPPPDIVLLVEDQESHELRNVTLVVGDVSKRPKDERRESTASHVSHVSVKGEGFGDTSREMKCWKCNKLIYTNTKKVVTATGVCSSIVVCLLCPLIAICAIPAIMKKTYTVVHQCPLCKIRLGASIAA